VLDALTHLREELSRVEAGYCGGIKLYGRADFLPAGDARAYDEVGFARRLSVAFGAPVARGDCAISYCLVHRESGVQIEAYSGPSGPAYGGSIDAQEAIDARIAMDPILRAGRPMDFVLQHAWTRRMRDAMAGSARCAAITRLDRLLFSLEV
jgi:hypothetical protein